MKTFYIVIASALFIQTISAQCAGYSVAPAISLSAAGCGCGNGLGNGFSLAGINSNGGPLNVATSAPFAPTGITIVSENQISGSLAVEGQLPFLAAISLEGQVPSAGSAGVSYSCGSSDVGIVSQGQAGGQSFGSDLGYGANIGSTYGAGSLSGLGGLSIGGIPSGCGCGGY